MRHRRHTPLASPRPRRLRAAAAVPCAAAVLTAVLTGTAPCPDAHAAGRGTVHAKSAAAAAEDGSAAKSPRVHATSRHAAYVRPSPSASDRRGTEAERAPDRAEDVTRDRSHGRSHDFGPAGDGVSGAAPQQFDEDEGLFGDQDLYEPPLPEQVPHGRESASPSGRAPTTAATGEMSPVLPLGAGMTLIGLGLALIALRLRHT